MKRTKKVRFPRRGLKSNRLPSWCAFVTISGRGSNGNGKNELGHKIYFGAFNGGNAKVKALPRVQSFLNHISPEFSGSPRVDVFLGRSHEGGKRSKIVYRLRKRASYMSALVRARRASEVFVPI